MFFQFTREGHVLPALELLNAVMIESSGGTMAPLTWCRNRRGVRAAIIQCEKFIGFIHEVALPIALRKCVWILFLPWWSSAFVLDGELIDPELALYPIGRIRFGNVLYVLCVHFVPGASKPRVVAVLHLFEGPDRRQIFDVVAGSVYKFSYNGVNKYDDARNIAFVFFSAELQQWFKLYFGDASLENVKSMKTKFDCDCVPRGN